MYGRYMLFRDPIDFSFVYILHLRDDLWPRSREGSEKPITKDFQFSHLNLIGRWERRDQQVDETLDSEFYCLKYFVLKSF